MSTSRMNRQTVRWSTPRRAGVALARGSRRAQCRLRLHELLQDPRLSSFRFLTPAVLGRELFEAFSPVAKLAIEILPTGPLPTTIGAPDRAALLEREGIVVLGLGEAEVMASPSTLVDFLLALLAALTDPTPPEPIEFD